VANRQRETEETAQIRKAPPDHRPSQPSHPQPEHNERHTPRLTVPKGTSETHTERRRRHMSRRRLPVATELQPHRQERPQPNHHAKKQYDHAETWKPSMARHDHAMA